MRRKIIISTTIASIAIALAVFCFGVYASMVQEFSITNIIGFTSSKNVFLSFVGSVDSCKQTEMTTPPGGYNTVDEYLYDKNFRYENLFEETDRNYPDAENNFTWQILDPVSFINEKTPIVYKIEIANYSEVKIKINLTFKQNGINISNKVALEVKGNNQLDEPNNYKIDDYNGSQQIVLDEYVLGQTVAPSKCVLTISTSVTGNKMETFEEENNFSLVATIN